MPPALSHIRMDRKANRMSCQVYEHRRSLQYTHSRSRFLSSLLQDLQSERKASIPYRPIHQFRFPALDVHHRARTRTFLRNSQPEDGQACWRAQGSVQVLVSYGRRAGFGCIWAATSAETRRTRRGSCVPDLASPLIVRLLLTRSRIFWTTASCHPFTRFAQRTGGVPPRTRLTLRCMSGWVIVESTKTGTDCSQP